MQCLNQKPTLLSFLIIFIIWGQLSGQLREIDSLKLEIQRVENDSLRIRVLGDLAYYYSSVDPDSCLYYASETFQLAKAIKSLRGMINGRYKMAMAYQSLGQYSEAIQMGQDVIDLSTKKKDTFRMTVGLNLLGVILSQDGQFPEAIDRLFKSAELSDITGDKINSAYAYNNIGEIYQKGDNFDEAYKYFKQSLEIWESETDTFELVTAYNNIGGLTKDSLEQYNYLRKAVALGEQINYNIGLAYAYRTLGNFQWKNQKNLAAAELSFEKALSNARKGGEAYTLTNNLIDLAAIKMAREKNNEARTLIDEGLQLSEEYGLEEEKQEVSEYLAELEYKEGRYKLAYDHLSTASDLGDSIYSQQLIEEMSDANAKYQLSQKEAEIAQQELEITKQKNARNRILFAGIVALLLATAIYQWYYNQQRKKQSIQLIEFNHKLANAETQALRAQMNPHFIFNALNSIKLYMLNQKPEKGSVYLDAFARLVRSVLQNSKEPLISLEKELEALDLYIGLEKLRFDEAFEHEINIAEDLETDFYQVPPLILQPYVENAIWHGLMPLKSKGKLSIDAALDHETLVINIEDNGIGRKMSGEKKTLDLPYKKSMGMDITQDRMELQKELTGMEIKAQIHDLVDNTGKGTGTRVEIRVGY